MRLAFEQRGFGLPVLELEVGVQLRVFERDRGL
jgi:hypothetical protein